MELTEEQIILGCKNGKRKARNKLYKLYANKLLGICLRYTRNKSEAEDVLHDAFIKIFTKIDQYSGKGSFEAWMKRIVVNTAIQSLRDRNKSRRIFNEYDLDNERIVEEADDEIPQLSAKELLRIVQELPEGYKLVFNMYVIDNMPHKDIADKLGISVSTSKSQLFRAKKHLKSEIEKRINNLNIN